MAFVPETDRVDSIEALERLYGRPAEASLRKEVDYIHPYYRAFIEAAPFAVLATGGPSGLDASPRGDPPGFVVVRDDKTLLLPDRRGNNRIDSLRNIIHDPRVALLFLVPGVGETLRVNGCATITTDPQLRRELAMEGREPTTVIVVHVEAVYFQCSRALLRSGLWRPERQVPRETLPSLGTILEALSGAEIDGGKYDEELPRRLRTTLY